jgi:hypothetical protein
MIRIDPDPFTFEQLTECAEREVKQRRNVYPRRVDEQKMTAHFAKLQTDMMIKIASIMRQLDEADPKASGRML